MPLSRRQLLQAAGVAGADLVLPKTAADAAEHNRLKVAYSLTGGTTTDGALVHSVLSHQDRYQTVNLAVSSSAVMNHYRLVGRAQVDADGIVRHYVDGLEPDSVYYARLVGNGGALGDKIRFKTMPWAGTSWTRKIAVVSCQGNPADHHSTELAWRDVHSWSPDDIWHLGDWGYWGQLIPAHGSYRMDLYHYLRSMRAFPTMRRTLESASLNAITISDHELTIGGDPVHGIHNSPASIRELVAFQKLMPVRQYGDTRVPRRGRYYSFDIGTQVRVIVTDFRSPDRTNADRPDGPHKTMFGQTQLAWIFTTLDKSKVNLLVNETSWLADPDQQGRAEDKPWFYRFEQQKIVDYIQAGGYQVAWIGGDRHYVGYLAGSGEVHNTLGGFPCYISSGMAKESLELQKGELMTWQFGAHHGDGKRQHPVCGYMRIVLSYDAYTGEVSMTGQGRAVLDTSQHVKDWQIEDIPGGLASDSWHI